MSSASTSTAKVAPAGADFASVALSSRFVDDASIEARLADLARRTLKGADKVRALETAIALMDLTTLEGKDTPERVKALCLRAMRPDPRRPELSSCAAVCVYPSLVPVAKRALEGSRVRVASVATAFPSGLSPLAVRIEDTRQAVELGADEIDMVIDRGAFLAGEDARVFDEIAAVKQACGAAHLKVILETGELGSLSAVRRASDLAIAAGADFIKTSTGKVQPAATPAVTLVMLQAVADTFSRTGRVVGMKPAGGVRTSKQAIAYLVLVQETVGAAWLVPERFRFGASALLADVLLQLEKERTGAYPAGAYVAVD
jgi:deoxyribose-phosphate aldolase